MNAGEFAKGQLEMAFGLVNSCAGGMDDAQYNFSPGGTANTPAKSHVHAMTSLDFFLSGIAQGKPLLWAEFAPQHGLPANPMEIWGYGGEVPLAAMNEYAMSVQKRTLKWVASLSDEDFDREVETNFFGKKSIAFLLQLGGMHAVGHAGDMAAVKGIQGLKGLPF